MTQAEATHLRNRVVRAGWTWIDEPGLNDRGFWEIEFKPSGKDPLLAYARDRQVHSDTDEREFIMDLERSIALALMPTRTADRV